MQNKFVLGALLVAVVLSQSACDTVKKIIYGEKAAPPAEQQQASAPPPLPKPEELSPPSPQANPFLDGEPKKEEEAKKEDVEFPVEDEVKAPPPPAPKAKAPKKATGKKAAQKKQPKKSATTAKKKAAPTPQAETFYDVEPEARAPRAEEPAVAAAPAPAPAPAKPAPEPSPAATDDELKDAFAEDDFGDWEFDEKEPAVAAAPAAPSGETAVARVAPTPNQIMNADTIRNAPTGGLLSVSGLNALTHQPPSVSPDGYRMTLEFPSSTVAEFRNPIPTRTPGIIKSAEFSQTESGAKLVVLTDRPASFDLSPQGSDIQIAVNPRGGDVKKQVATTDELDTPGNVLTRISAQQSDGFVDIEIEAQDSFGYKVFKKGSPFRLQIDIPNVAQGSTVGQSIVVNQGPVGQINVSETAHDDKPLTRVIVGLDRAPDFIPSIEGNVLKIRVRQ